MSIVKYDPYYFSKESENFFDDESFLWPSRFFDSDFDWSNRYLSENYPSTVYAHRHDPAVNIYETDSEWVYMVELPGVKESDIRLGCDGGYLKLTAERKFDNGEAWKGYHRRELCEGKFERYFKLHDGSNIDGIKASLKDGILKIMVQKDEHIKARTIDIKAA